MPRFRVEGVCMVKLRATVSARGHDQAQKKALEDWSGSGWTSSVVVGSERVAERKTKKKGRKR